LYAGAELGSSPAATGKSYLPGALAVRLYNPLRGSVDSVSTAYDGKQKAAELDPLPPVAYENRFGIGDKTEGMRVAGSYYLAVTLSPEVAASFGTAHTLTLAGERQGAGGAGAFVRRGRSGPRGGGRCAGGAERGDAGGGGRRDRHGQRARRRLGVWMLVARRRAAAGW